MDMRADPLKDIVARLAEPLAASLGLALWGVEAAFGGRGLVRVFVDAPQGVGVDQCAEISRLLGLALDAEDCMTGPYLLEVSSPGLERVFFTAEQLAGAVGGQVEITLLEPLGPDAPRKKFQGRLAAAAGGSFTLALADPPGQDGDSPRLVFSFAQVKTARLRPVFPEKTRPGKSGAGKKAPRPGQAGEGNSAFGNGIRPA